MNKSDQNMNKKPCVFVQKNFVSIVVKFYAGK